MRPRMMDPERDLKGATPETLARALLRRKEPLIRPGGGIQPVVGDQIPVEEVPSDEPDDGIIHLGEGV